MRKLTNRRIRTAVLAAALAATTSVMSAPAAAFAATATAAAGSAAQTAADDDPDDQGGPISPGAGEGEEEVLTVAEDAQLTAAGYGAPIHRDDVMTRAKDWYARNVQYSGTGGAWDLNHGKTYRPDCSGFVSMAWKLKTSKTTWTLDDVSHVINWNDLLRGDAIVHEHDHAVLFDKWVDADTKADFWVYEEGRPATDMNHRTIHVVDIRGDGFKPYRYDGIRK
ncbi:hypothetical protein [Actinoplanes sp. N902-109]|uniref:hypothetical protein n=1 Tax=Actinoplanes sp. (strain N902-109) TaxID=649831 RepID=UPI00032941F4|nr:hypothetical protein [Actinoplanes sp. N902-109]AGL17170.1 FG-GAP repeat domain-containing protein [Actinoplanes sp. N902-109]